MQIGVQCAEASQNMVFVCVWAHLHRWRRLPALQRIVLGDRLTEIGWEEVWFVCCKYSSPRYVFYASIREVIISIKCIAGGGRHLLVTIIDSISLHATSLQPFDLPHTSATFTTENRNVTLKNMIIFQLNLHLEYLSDASRRCDILCFSCWKRNCWVPFARPRDQIVSQEFTTSRSSFPFYFVSNLVSVTITY